MTPQQARHIIARAAIWAATRDINWGNYPEIGQHDWQDILDHIDQHAPQPDTEQFNTAYHLLEARARAHSEDTAGQANP